MRNDGQKPQGGGSGRTNGILPTSFRAFSSYLRIVSSGASTVASTVRSAASAIVDRDNDATHDQVLWACFDKLEWEGGITRQVLLLAYRSGFQVWDVEEADNVHDLVSRHDGSVSFVQVLPKPLTSKKTWDKFADNRPLLVVCADTSLSGGGNVPGALSTPCNRTAPNCHDTLNVGFMPTVVWFYSLRSQSYVHVLKFRSAIYSVRCSTRVVAISQAAQIHCLDAATLEKEYTILTNPIVAGCSAFGGIGYGPLAVGPRWLAYSGSPVAVSNSGRVNPQHLNPSPSFPASASNGSLVAHYARESSKQLAAGIVTLGDVGYKKLSRYYSELLPDNNNSSQRGSVGSKVNGIVNGYLPDAENVGMVIVRDIVSKSPIAQFRAHKSPISSLCFDPSGTLLVTASVQGHNINVFRIIPGQDVDISASDSSASYIHLYRLQRGFTNAVIQDVSFSDDSQWIMISSSRGTNHLFAISPFGGPVDILPPDTCISSKNSGSGVTKPAIRWTPNSGSPMLNQHNLYASGPPITLSVVSRIRSGSNGWRSSVSGAAAVATGRTSSFSGAIASVFHKCKVNEKREGAISLKAKYHLLVFSPSGCMVQYVMRASLGQEFAAVVSGPSSYGSPDIDPGLVVDAIQKWDICRKHNRREREDNSDIYGENGNSESSKIFPEEVEKDNGGFPKARGSLGKAKISPDERHHLFISEAELQMHETQIPLWAKSEIYFQSMAIDGTKSDEEYGYGGEIEIERIPTRMIEARSKDLVPVFDYLRTSTPKLQHARTSILDKNTNKQLLHQTSGLSENGRLSCRSSASSLDSMVDGVTAITELHGGTENTCWEGLHVRTDTMKSSVNSSNHSPKSNTRLHFVNNIESATVEAHIKFVNNNIEGQKMENQFEDEGGEFD